MRSTKILLWLVAILAVLFFLGFFGMREGFVDCASFQKSNCNRDKGGECAWNSTTKVCEKYYGK